MRTIEWGRFNPGRGPADEKQLMNSASLRMAHCHALLVTELSCGGRMSQAAPDSYGRSSADGTAAPEPRELRRQYSWALQGASPRQQEGQLLGWGRNDFAQLGSSTRTFSISEDDTDPGGQAPMAILPERQIVDVAGSVFSSALLTGRLSHLPSREYEQPLSPCKRTCSVTLHATV